MDLDRRFGHVEEALKLRGCLAALFIRCPERVIVGVDVHNRVLEQHFAVARKQAGNVIRMRMSDDDDVDGVRAYARGGEVLGEPTQSWGKILAAAGID